MSVRIAISYLLEYPPLLDRNRDIVSWGSNEFGQLGRDGELLPTNLRLDVRWGQPIVICSGQTHSAALTSTKPHRYMKVFYEFPFLDRGILIQWGQLTHDKVLREPTVMNTTPIEGTHYSFSPSSKFSSKVEVVEMGCGTNSSIVAVLSTGQIIARDIQATFD